MKIDEKLDLSILPEEAKKELYDFYLFLLTKYSKKELKDNDDDFLKNLIPRKIKNLKPIMNREYYYAR